MPVGRNTTHNVGRTRLKVTEVVRRLRSVQLDHTWSSVEGRNIAIVMQRGPWRRRRHTLQHADGPPNEFEPGVGRPIARDHHAHGNTDQSRRQLTASG